MSNKQDELWRKLQKVEEEEEQAPALRHGVCPTCNNGSFTLEIHKHSLLRCCKTCLEVYNTDTNKVIRKGVWENVEVN